MNVHVNGKLTPCCYQSHGDAPYHFQDWQQWRGVGLKELKEDLCSGRRNKSCQGCWDLEDNGARSYRQQYNDTFAGHPAKYIDTVLQSPGDMIYDLEFLHLDFDNYCNLRCIMCHPTVSSSIESEYIKHKEKYAPFLGDISLVEKKWHDTAVYQQLEKKLSVIKYLMLTGGEPLINPKVIDLLRSFPNLSELDLTVTTNASLIKEETWKLLARAKNLAIIVSLEGIGAQNDYLRYGSTWSNVEQNIRKFCSLPNIKYGSVTINHVLQFTSQWTLVPLIKFCTKNRYDLCVNRLYSPPYLSIDGMTDHEKNQLMRSLNEIHDYADTMGANGHWIRSAIAELKKSCHDDQKRRKFFEYVSMLDQIRGTNFSEIFSENNISER